jgi:N-methylhydantoinase B/oxoprolinase/acetone carboxylase alpha subunit
MNNLTFGNETYQYYETICSGSPAGYENSGRGFNGTSGVHTHMTNSRLTDPEILEMRFPVSSRISTSAKARAARAGSSGRQRHDGGPSAFSSAWISRSSPRTATARRWASMAAARRSRKDRGETPRRDHRNAQSLRPDRAGGR